VEAHQCDNNWPAETPVARAAIFTPTLLASITIEELNGAADIHLHAAGQGMWIARMLVELGIRTSLCGPVGGEIGDLLPQLAGAERVDLRWVSVNASSGAYVHDRRTGEREPLAAMPAGPLNRHELDELYGIFLSEAVDAQICVLAGPSDPGVLPDDTYERLARDVRGLGSHVVADLSGGPLAAALSGGVPLVKVSHEQLLTDGLAASDGVKDLLEAMRSLQDLGAQNVVVSRAERPALALVGSRAFCVSSPALQRVDHRGAGDAMTAGMAASLARGENFDQALSLGAAAGAVTVTRHGLASGRRETIERLARLVSVRPLKGNGDESTGHE
jgi:1-phosphofructokinase